MRAYKILTGDNPFSYDVSGNWQEERIENPSMNGFGYRCLLGSYVEEHWNYLLNLALWEVDVAEPYNYRRGMLSASNIRFIRPMNHELFFKTNLGHGHVAILVDKQQAFSQFYFPLYVQGAENTSASIYKWLMSRPYDFVAASIDCHPKNHVSFASRWGKKPFSPAPNGDTYWPDHAIMGSAETELVISPYAVDGIYLKGTDPEEDAYSALRAENLENDMYKWRVVRGVDIFGDALDVCVKATALDVKQSGDADRVRVIVNLCSAVWPDKVPETLKELTDAGIELGMYCAEENKVVEMGACVW